MKLFKPVVLSALLIPLFFACSNSNKKDAKTLADIQVVPMENKVPVSNNEADKMYAAADTTAIADDQRPGNQADQKQKTPTQKNARAEKIDWDKKIVKNASLNLEVKDYKTFNNQLHEIVKQFGGYVSQEEQNESAYQIENKVSIKVPVDQFDDAVSKLTAGSEKIIERKITSEDVTTEMVDTKSRIEAKKEVRLRYLELLKQAKNMKDILEVQSEINEIQEQLESAAGRVAYLNHSSAFSTINLVFYQVTNATAINEKEPTYLHKINEAFSGGLSWISNLILGLVSLWPLIVSIIILIVIYKKKKTAKPKAAQS